MKNSYQKLLKIILVIAISMFSLIQPVIATTNVTANDKAWEFFDQAIENIENNNYQQAFFDLTKVINLGHVLIPAAYSNRCLVNLQLDNHQAAKLDCKEAIKFNPNNTEAYLNWGLAEYRLGNYEQALAQYQEVIKKNHDDYRAYYNQGLVNFALEKYQIAFENYDKALVLTQLQSPSEVGLIYNNRGLVYLKLKNIENAIADFTQAINLDKSNIMAYYNRAYAYEKKQNYLASIADLSRVIRLNPSSTLSYVNRGRLYYFIGLQQAALRDFKIALNQFEEQGKIAAYQQTLSLINQFKENIIQSNRMLYS
ncbi:MAG TPA: hypothetical protein DCF68_02180 [Cyanothece sp. UBA12306]|nr:hypothetical protein [Cyanothece sp. UBA12306]